MFVIEDIGRSPVQTTDMGNMSVLQKKADKDGSGELDFEEFLGFLSAYYQSVYMRVFSEHDKDGSGTVSVEELEPLLAQIRNAGFEVPWDDVAEQVLESVDKDGNGELDFKEFCALMVQYRKIEFEQLEKSAGFTLRQVEFLKELYEKADEDDSGVLEIKEVVGIVERTLMREALETEDEITRFIQLFARMD